jgi:Flp pilus assembly protein TadD
MLTLGAYVHYVRRPRSLARYGLVLVLFALGLMSKPMLVTLPVVLLLLDYWPLKRWPTDGVAGGCATGQFSPDRRVPWPLVLEKLPLLALSIVCGVATLWAQQKALQAGSSFSLSLRLGNALVAGIIYLGQMVYPAGLAVFYPYPRNGLATWEVALAGLLLAGISAGVIWQRRERPWLLTGWFWYLVMLLPVIGIIQVGEQAHADRYTYLPQIGVYLAVTWLAAEWGAKWHAGQPAAGGLMAGVIAVLMVCAWKQTGYWRDSETLWTHTLACTRDNNVAHCGMGSVLLKRKRVGDAMIEYQQAVRIRPDYVEGYNGLGIALVQKGRLEEAIVQFDKALQIAPANATVQINLAWLLATAPQASLRNGSRAVALAREANGSAGGNNPLLLHTLAAALAEAGRFPEAVQTARRAQRLAVGQSNANLAARLEAELEIYQADRPFHMPE